MYDIEATLYSIHHSLSIILQCETLPDKTMQIREPSLNAVEMSLAIGRDCEESLCGY